MASSPAKTREDLKRFAVVVILLLTSTARSTPVGAQEKDTGDVLKTKYREAEKIFREGSLDKSKKALTSMMPEKQDIDKLFGNHAASLWPLISRQNDESTTKGELEEIIASAKRNGPVAEVQPVNVRENDRLVAQKYKAVLGALAGDVRIYELQLKWEKTTGGSGPYCYVNGRWVLIPFLPELLEKAMKPVP